MFKKRIFTSIFLALMCIVTAMAGNYSLKRGGTLTVNCTATPPAGYITHTFYELVNPEDAYYLGMSYTTSEQCVTYYGLHAKANIKVEVTYAYSYRGTYDNNMHVGHGSYYDYITVTGAPDATGIEIREGAQISMRPGQTVTLHADLKPAGAIGYVDWGFIDAFGSPFNFDVSYNSNGTEAYVTGVRTGQTMMFAWINEDEHTIRNITLKCTNNANTDNPTALSLSPETSSIEVGGKIKLVPQFTPDNSFSEITWSSSDPNIATVDRKGEVTGVGGGEVTIKAVTQSGVEASATVTVTPTLTDFTVPSSLRIYKGYRTPVEYSLYPSGAKGKLTWSSNDVVGLAVSSDGVLTAKQPGTYTVRVYNSALSKERNIQVTVIEPSLVESSRQAGTRLGIIKTTINELLKNK